MTSISSSLIEAAKRSWLANVIPKERIPQVFLLREKHELAKREVGLRDISKEVLDVWYAEVEKYCHTSKTSLSNSHIANLLLTEQARNSGRTSISTTPSHGSVFSFPSRPGSFASALTQYSDAPRNLPVGSERVHDDQSCTLPARMLKRQANRKVCKEGNGKFFCSVCDCRFTRGNDMKTHVQDFHENRGRFKCHHCNFVSDQED